MISRTAGALLVISGFAANGLAADAKQEFEVASIKPAPPLGGQGMFRMGSTGGPGTRDPGRYSCEGCPLIMLVTQAYDLKRYQVGNYPSWMDTERFNVTAKVPEGATKEQFRQMQQNLLADRFGLKIHYDKKEMPTYELVVNKGGHKMKEAVEDPNAKDAPPPPLGTAPPPLPPPPGAGGAVPMRITMGADGFPQMPAGMRGRGGPMMMMMNGRAKMKATDTTMEQLVTTLSNQMGRPITDGTGLKGKYEFSLDWSPEPGSGRGGPMMGAGGGVAFAVHSDGGGGGGRGGAGGGDAPLQGVSDEPTGPTIFAALQQQLGLKLEQKKALIDILTVDKAEKTPTEN